LPPGLIIYGSNGQVVGSSSLAAVYNQNGEYVGSYGIDPSTGNYSSWVINGVETDLTSYLVSQGLAESEPVPGQQVSTQRFEIVITATTSAVGESIQQEILATDPPAPGALPWNALGTPRWNLSDYGSSDNLIVSAVQDQYGENIGLAVSGYTETDTAQQQSSLLVDVYDSRGQLLGKYSSGQNFYTYNSAGVQSNADPYLRTVGFTETQISDALQAATEGSSDRTYSADSISLSSIEQALNQYVLTTGESKGSLVSGFTDVYNPVGRYVGSYGADLTSQDFATWNSAGVETNQTSLLAGSGITESQQTTAISQQTELQLTSVQSDLGQTAGVFDSIASDLADNILAAYAPTSKLYDSAGNLIVPGDKIEALYDGNGVYQGSEGIDPSTGDSVFWNSVGTELDVTALANEFSEQSTQSTRTPQFIVGPPNPPDGSWNDAVESAEAQQFAGACSEELWEAVAGQIASDLGISTTSTLPGQADVPTTDTTIIQGTIDIVPTSNSSPTISVNPDSANGSSSAISYGILTTDEDGEPASQICYIDGPENSDGSLSGTSDDSGGLSENISLAPARQISNLTVSAGASQIYQQAINDNYLGPLLSDSLTQLSQEGYSVVIETYAEATSIPGSALTIKVNQEWEPALGAATFSIGGTPSAQDGTNGTTVYVVLGTQDATIALEDPIAEDGLISHENSHLIDIEEAIDPGALDNYKETPVSKVPGLTIPPPSGMTIYLNELNAYGAEVETFANGNDLASVSNAIGQPPPGLGFSTWTAFYSWYSANYDALNNYGIKVLRTPTK